MKKYLFSALVTLAGLFVLAASSQAQTGDILVQIKQDFTAGGKALPAGTYKVFRSVTGTDQVLILRGQQSEASTFLISTSHDARAPKQPEVKLTRAGDVYYLSEVATELGVYTLAAPRVETRTAKGTGHDTTFPTGSN